MPQQYQASATALSPRACPPFASAILSETKVGGLGLPLAVGIRLENDLATLLRTTEGRVEGAKAFVEKRKPRWTGK